MKKIYIFITAVVLSTGTTFGQLTCGTAVQNNPNQNCTYSSHIATDTVMYFWFKATSEYVNIQVITEKFGIDIPHIHKAELCSGTCGNLVVIASDELPFYSQADRLGIDLDGSQLVVGDIYYIRLSRGATGVKCDKGSCYPIINPATFDLCIEEIDVLIPVDMQLESPAISHTYYQQRGQLLHTDGTPASEVKLYSIRSNPRVYIADEFTSFVFSSIDTSNTTLDTLQRVDMTLVGANPGTRVFKTEKTKDMLHYFYPHIPKGVTGNKGYSRGVCNDVYPYIDMQLYSNSHGLKLYFIVRPSEATPNMINLKFSGADNVSVTGNDGLKIETSIGEMEFERAHVYRIHPTNNSIVPMPASGSFVDLGNNQFKFNVQNYPANWTLVIAVDEKHSLPAQAPAIGNLEWCAYLGGDASDKAWATTVDNNGKQYVVGSTTSLLFPTTPGAYQDSLSSSIDVFFSKFGKNHRLIYSTYYAGTVGEHAGYDIETNSINEVYVYGRTTANDFPTLQKPGAYYDGSLGGGEDAFILKFDSSAATPALLWATYFGAFDFDGGRSMVIDGSDNVYITGVMRDGMPLVTPAGAYSQTYGGNLDAFIAKFNSQDSLVWFTYYGGNTLEIGLSINIDGNNNLFVSGVTYSDDFSTYSTGNAYIDNTLDGLIDGFIVKFNPIGAREWATYIGGNDNDQATNYYVGYGRIAFDNANNIFFTGDTKSPDFPTLNPGGGAYFDGTYSADGQSDGFVMQFNGNDLSLIWSTYIGDTGWDAMTGIWIDSKNRIFLAGNTFAQGFPNVNYPGFYNQDSLAGTGGFGDDGVVVFMNSSKQIEWATFFGGYSTSPDQDAIHGIVVIDDSLYIAGYTSSKGDTGNAKIPFVYFTGAYNDSTFNGGGYDAFVAMFSIDKLSAIGEMQENDQVGNLLVYPNPANEYITVFFETKANTEVTLQIYNIEGKLAYKAKRSAYHGRNLFTVDMRKFANGIYTVNVEAGGKTATAKLVKQ